MMKTNLEATVYLNTEMCQNMEISEETVQTYHGMTRSATVRPGKGHRLTSINTHILGFDAIIHISRFWPHF